MAEPFRFRTAVRREISATWSRFRWVWIVLAVLVEAFLLFTPLDVAGTGGLGTPTFLFLGFVLAWGPAWLCSDLLSLRFKANPEPLREWRSVEILARAIGRLLPFYAAGAVWSGSWTARHLIAEMREEFSLTFGSLITSWPQFWGSWPAWALVPLAGGLLLASTSALLSALFRRPRRVIITLTMLLLGSAVNGAIVYAGLSGWGASDPLQAVLTGASLPNLFLGLSVSYLLHEAASRVGFQLENGFQTVCWLTVLGFLLLTVPFVLWTWWIAARRLRRHPHTAAPVADGAVVLEVAGG